MGVTLKFPDGTGGVGGHATIGRAAQADYEHTDEARKDGKGLEIL